MPAEVVDYVAGQLGIADPSCVKRYTERRTTRFEHAEEVKRAYGLRDFAAAEAELASCCPGVTTLARLVARVRDETTARPQEVLAGLLTGRQRQLLDRLLEVPAGARVSDLERWRKTPLKAQNAGRSPGPRLVTRPHR